MSDRGIHPDLLEEETAAQEAEPQEVERTAPRRGRGRQASPTPAPTPAATSDAETPLLAGGESEAAAPPEWFSQAREAFDKDPAEAFKVLARNLPKEQLEQDETLSGFIGSRADLRARAILQQQQRDAEERAKLEAAQNNDLYTLGELTQKEYQARIAQQQAAQAAGPFMDGVVLFQQSLPDEIQREVAGKVFGEGKGQAQGVAEYLQYIADARTRLEVEKEISRRESALRKSVLSEVNGDEPVPEREGGTPGRVREVTDEQIAAMSMREYDALFDENGHPKPGVRHRATRSIPLTQR